MRASSARAGFEVGQFQIGLQHILLGDLIGLVSGQGDGAEFPHQFGVGGVDFGFAADQVVIEQGVGGRLGQSEAEIGDVLAGGVGLGLGDVRRGVAACRTRGFFASP